MNISIPSQLEDQALSVYEYRVYIHLAGLMQSQALEHNTFNMARVCQISERQVRRALTSLLEQNLIRVTSKTQQARTFALTNVQTWRQNQTACDAPRTEGPIQRTHKPFERPTRPQLEPELKRLTRPQQTKNTVNHAKLELDQNANGLPVQAQTAYQTDAPTRDANFEMPKPPAPVKRQKTMQELLATTPLNGTWGRG